MPFFFRGAGVGTYWHENDARHTGFVARTPNAPPTTDLLANHIANGTVISPFISLTRSFSVACSYAAFFGRLRATEQNPGYVYQITLARPLPEGLKLIDPVKWIARIAPEPTEPVSYQHDGPPDVLLGVVNPSQQGHYLKQPCLQPPGDNGKVTPNTLGDRPPYLSVIFLTLVRALRDSEILACGIIPTTAIVYRFEVFWDGFKLVTKNSANELLNQEDV